MDEYISKDAVLKAFKLTAKNPNKDYQRGIQDTIDCLVPEVIADIPTADVQPVKRGRWSECFTDMYHYSGICSVCGKVSIKTLTESLYAFCPNCGARMDGGAEND
jgi:DNA-directed RNA polymerase subunit RPC12/RpoP